MSQLHCTKFLTFFHLNMQKGAISNLKPNYAPERTKTSILIVIFRDSMRNCQRNSAIRHFASIPRKKRSPQPEKRINVLSFLPSLLSGKPLTLYFPSIINFIYSCHRQKWDLLLIILHIDQFISTGAFLKSRDWKIIEINQNKYAAFAFTEGVGELMHPK